jgi:pimeloyl-ACP methyl ester carboxylesterase
MTATNPLPEQQTPDGSPTVGRVERLPFYLRSGTRSLFATLHRHESRASAHGVLICAPLGHEQVHAHRALRHLADSCAECGIQALRLDYDGVGDSDGTDHDPQRCATWLSNVGDAVTWLREEAGCSTVSLVGLRIGALLAARYAEKHPVENLVLWAPVIKGRRYTRELNALVLAATHQANADSSVLEAAAFTYTQETLNELAEMDMLSVQPRCARGLIVNSEAGRNDPLLIQHLSKQGVAFEEMTQPGYVEMMLEPQHTAVPREAILAITQWTSFGLSKSATESAEMPRSHSGLAKSTTLTSSSGASESIHRLSVRPDLMGIVCRPESAPAHLPWIVMINAGAAYHIGPGRLYVKLARDIAAHGFPSLRMDLCGLGDSVTDSESKENEIYAASSLDDVARACAYLQELEPKRSIVLMGLCSGAYAAFQLAVQSDNPGVVGGIMINPLTFYWREGMVINDEPDNRLRVWHYYLSAICNPKSWRLLLSGQTKEGIVGTIRRFIRKMLATAPKPSTATVADPNSQTPGTLNHPAKDDLAADLNQVDAAGRSLAMFVSEGDPGYFLLMARARRKARQLIGKGTLKCFHIANADHTFSSDCSRQALSDALSDYLQERFATTTQPMTASAAQLRNTVPKLSAKPL